MNAFPTPESVAAQQQQVPTVQPLAPVAAPDAPETQLQDLDTVIMLWKSADEQLQAIKKQERDLRDQIIGCNLWNAQKTTGVQTHRLGHGWELKLTNKESVSVENKNGEAAAVYNQLQALGGGSADRGARLFTFSVRMSEKVYDELTDAEKALVDPLLTRKPGSPSLKLKAPKC